MVSKAEYTLLLFSFAVHYGVLLRNSFHVVKSETKNNDEIDKIQTPKLLLYPCSNESLYDHENRIFQVFRFMAKEK